MAATTDALTSVLEDARRAHSAVIARFVADLAVTPEGPHRQVLEEHVAYVQACMTLMDGCLQRLRGRRVRPDLLGPARRIAQDAVLVGRMPVAMASRMGAAALRGRGRGPADGRRLLRNVADEYGITARALAASQAGETVASHTGDDVALDLFAALRREDQQVLKVLGASLTEHAAALARSGGQGAPFGGLLGAVTRKAVSAWDGARRDWVGAGVAGARRAAGKAQGAASREEALPIARYGRMTGAEIAGRLHGLSSAELAWVEGYERAHARRPEVLRAVDKARAASSPS
ncbi:hypothetical protein ACIP98_13885 [Streptomyces sp. NPDC088354]|uniref:hypothetical protein n=1 Tax=unclassified Streptomyces TaxID=2593676 RepID=UPI0029A6146A|nr:hypothetical protein [Streptomyces sp. MI02-7b]MDX3071056.1 hypothetical protein [Streptomyces sp. MI02-7b]